MKLQSIAKGKGLRHRIKLGLVGTILGERPSDIVSVLFYRPELFGGHLGRYVHALLRGTSEWTLGERELFATYISHCNSCRFCTASHRAVADRALGADVVSAVLADYRTAPISEGVRAVLELLEKLSSDPVGIAGEDIDRVFAAGVSARALETAIHIACAFNVINRVADALGFDTPTASLLAKEAEILIKRGYAPPPF
jgi:uncharacterized peroxidase-related enzyme